MLKRFSIRTLEDLFAGYGDVLRFLVHEHTTLRVRQDDSNRSRWPLHALWALRQKHVATLPAQGVVREADADERLLEQMMRLAIRVMKAPTLSLLLGLVLGAPSIAVGFGVGAHLSRKVEALVSECVAINQKPVPVDAPPWAKDPLVCEPRELESGGKLVGVQAGIVETHVASRAWVERSRIVGLLLFGL